MDCIGLKKLISEKIYSAAYPMHDKVGNELLLEEWGSYRKFTRNQPLDAIKDYFGVKIALYFAWLGFYTDMLIPVSLFGIFCFVYGLMTISSDTLSTDICNPLSNITMCPQCDQCDYWNLTEACFYAEITHTFDNYLTLVFAIVMSVWSALYLNSWKRYSAEIVHRWGLSNLQPETYYPRPEYLAKLKNLEATRKSTLKMKNCKITNKKESVVPWSIKAPIRIFSAACALFWVSFFK